MKKIIALAVAVSVSPAFAFINDGDTSANNNVVGGASSTMRSDGEARGTANFTMSFSGSATTKGNFDADGDGSAQNMFDTDTRSYRPYYYPNNVVK